MVFNEKICKIKAFYASPTMKLMVFFWITDNTVSTVKLFADDTSLFSAVNDVNIFADELNKDLQKYLNGSIDGKCHSILT